MTGNIIRISPKTMQISRPTIRDVARQAGVSHQTVSRVINGSADVLPETRNLVEAAIEKLGYRPSAIARSMARGQTHTLACISPNLTDYTFASVIEGAEMESRQHDYFMLSSSASDPEAFHKLVEELVGHRRVDGLIVINPYADQRFEFIPEDFPVVFVGSRSRQKTISSVCLDDEKAAYEATRHLISLGHTQLAMVTGPMEEDCSQDRALGYHRALQEAGLEVDETMIIEGDWSATSGQDALLFFVEQGRVPGAIFAQNDRMAMGVMHAARDVNLKVPAQLSVIGVDDMPLSSYFDPPLTTMRQDMPRIGQEASRILLDVIQEKNTALRELKLSAQLIERQSTSHKGGG
jgi:DNA-binding LacI/PurR family transcriptional regulator